jgi:polyferredoxin
VHAVRRMRQGMSMNINIMKHVTDGQRVLSSECIFCLTCTTFVPRRSSQAPLRWTLEAKNLWRDDEGTEPAPCNES